MRKTLFTLALLAATGGAQELPPSIVGTWKMNTKVRGREIGATLVITADKAGRLSGVWQSLGRDMELDDLKFVDGVLTFERVASRDRTIGFKAKLKGDTLTGAHTGQMGEIECTGKRISEADLKDPEKDYEIHSVRGAPRDGFDVLDHPKMTKAAAAKLADDQPVIGMRIGGEARAYPVRVMGSHEIVNDTCGGEPIAVSW